MIILPVGYRPAAAHHHARTPRSMRRSRSVRDAYVSRWVLPSSGGVMEDEGEGEALTGADHGHAVPDRCG
jgi:hypothetical protein